MGSFVPYYSAELIAEKSWMIRNSFSEDTEALCYLVEGRDYALLIDAIRKIEAFSQHFIATYGVK